MKLAIAAALACAMLVSAQDRDFLTPNEVDQIRDAQEPNQRLALYVHFAAERMDLLQQYLASKKPGRSIFIHDNLEDLANIIEAIDNVSDDALKHKADIDKGMIAVLNAEKQLQQQLQKIKDNPPPDFSRYRFVLDQALETVNDSYELSLEDSQKRGAEVIAADQKEKQEREAEMSKTELKDRQKQAESEDQQKKVPSLFRKGEKKPDDTQ